MRDPVIPEDSILARLVPLMVKHGDLLFGNKSPAYRAMQEALEKDVVFVSNEDIARVVRTEDLPDFIKTCCGIDEEQLQNLRTVLANGEQGCVRYTDDELKILLPLIAENFENPDYEKMVTELQKINSERTVQQLKNWKYNLGGDIAAVKRSGVKFIYDEQQLVVQKKVGKLMKIQDDNLSKAIRLINSALWKKYGSDAIKAEDIFTQLLAALKIGIVKDEEDKKEEDIKEVKSVLLGD